MDSISDEINHDDEKDIVNHETNDTSNSYTKINNSYESNIYGSLNEDGNKVNSSSAEQVVEESTPNDLNISLETREEKRDRKISLYICFATSFFNSTGFGMLNLSTWPYMKKVCVRFKS